MEGAPKSPNRIHDIDFTMPKNADVPTSSANVYRQIPLAGIDDLHETGVVRSGREVHGNPSKTYGTDVYWTRGRDGAYHNVQPEHAVLEAPHSVAVERVVTKEDLLGIYKRNEAGEVEKHLPLNQEEYDKKKLSAARARLGLGESK